MEESKSRQVEIRAELTAVFVHKIDSTYLRVARFPIRAPVDAAVIVPLKMHVVLGKEVRERRKSRETMIWYTCHRILESYQATHYVPTSVAESTDSMYKLNQKGISKLR